MAVTADKVVVELELRDGQYLSRVRQSEQAFTQAQNRVARSAEDAERRIRASSAGISSALKGAAAGIAAGVSVAAVKNLADTYTQLQNRLKVTGLEGAALEKQYERLNQVATDSRAGIEATVAVYSRLRLATEGIGLSNEQVTRTTEILAKSLSSSGATAQETSAALLQFSQAIGSGVLQGDELRSIRENAPAVARAIATEFGVTVGELKKLGEEGKLTSERVVQAVLASGTEIDALFAKTEATVGNALTNLGNQLLNYVGQTDDGLTATQRVAGAINLLADNLDKVVPVIATLATVVGGRYAIAMTTAAIQTGIATANSIAYQVALARMTAAQTGATTAQVLLNGALTANPIGIAVTAVALLAGGLAVLAARYNTTAVAARELDRVTSAADTAISDYAAAVLEAKSASGQERVELLKKAEALREVTAARIADARVAAQRQIDEAVSARARADASIGAVNRRREGQNDRSFSNASIIQDQAASQRAQADIALAVEERKQADLAIQAVDRLTAAQSRAAAGAVDGGGTGGGAISSEGGGTGRSGGGASADQIASARAELAIQEEINRARASGDLAAINAAEERRELAELTARYESAGYDDAATRATEQLALLNQVEERTETKARNQRLAEQAAESEARATETLRGIMDEILSAQEQNATTEEESLRIRREILAVRQAERREAIEAALLSKDITAEQRRQLEIALASLDAIEKGERGRLGSRGVRAAQDVLGAIGQSAGGNAADDANREDALDYINQQEADGVASHQDAMNARAQIDAAYWENRLTGEKSMLAGIASLQSSSIKELAALGKAAALAQAAIQGYLAIQVAVASAPFPFNIPAIAFATAQTAVNLAGIAGLKDGGIVTGTGGPREDNQLRRLSVGEFVNNAESVRKNRPYLEAANNGADLSKMLPGLRDGGYVSRVNVAAPRLSDRTGRSVSNVFSPSIDARGADLAAVSRIEQIMEEQSRTFADRVNGVRDRRNAYRLGGRK